MLSFCALALESDLPSKFLFGWTQFLLMSIIASVPHILLFEFILNLFVFIIHPSTLPSYSEAKFFLLKSFIPKLIRYIYLNF